MKNALWVDDFGLTDEEKILLLKIVNTGGDDAEEIEAEIKFIEDRAFESVILGIEE